MFARSVVIIAALVAASCSRQVPSLAGDWDATIVNLAKAEVPFRFVIGGTPEQPTGTFVNGDERMESTGGSFTDGAADHQLRPVRLEDHRAARLATRSRASTTGRPGAPPTPSRRYAPSRGRKTRTRRQIAGEWKIPTPDQKYEAVVALHRPPVGRRRVGGDSARRRRHRHADRFIPARGHGCCSATSRARGRCASRSTVNADGTLALLEDGQTRHTAVRMTIRAPPTAGDLKDPTQLTRVKDPNAPLALQFPDLNGTPVSLSDARFRGKVVILSITGSWCPNCHDEAPFLGELYRKYRDQGLEIVLLAFEEAGQLAEPGPAEGVREAVRHHVSGAAGRRTEGAEREAAAVRGSRGVSDQRLHRS